MTCSAIEHTRILVSGEREAAIFARLRELGYTTTIDCDGVPIIRWGE